MRKNRKIFIVIFYVILISLVLFIPTKTEITELKDSVDDITSVIIVAVNPKRNRLAQELPLEDLEEFMKTEFDLELFKDVIRNVEYKGPLFFFTKPFWKGGSLLIVNLSDGRELRFAAGYNGGLYSLNERGHLSLKKNPKIAKRFQHECRRISRKIFIPEARRRNRKELLAELPSLINDLNEGDSTRRMLATDMICRLGEAAVEAVPSLIKIVKNKDENWDIRHNAIYALGWIGPSAKLAIPVLEECLNEESFRSEAERSLKKINQTKIE